MWVCTVLACIAHLGKGYWNHTCVTGRHLVWRCWHQLVMPLHSFLRWFSPWSWSKNVKLWSSVVVIRPEQRGNVSLHSGRRHMVNWVQIDSKLRIRFRMNKTLKVSRTSFSSLLFSVLFYGLFLITCILLCMNAHAPTHTHTPPELTRQPLVSCWGLGRLGSSRARQQTGPDERVVS